MNELVLYGTPVSPFVRKVEAVLKHQGVDYDFENINIMDMPDWFVEISPARRIPVLRDRTIGAEGVSGTIADSSAICAFLDKRRDEKLTGSLYGDTAFDAGQVVWLEEYADSELAQPLGMKLFRPILFPRFAGKASDIETARQTYHEVLPKCFDYLETTLNGNEFFVGNRFSIADVAIGVQLTQMDIAVGLPDANRWPGLVKHCEAIKSRPGIAENLAACEKMLRRVLPEKVDLS